VKPHQCFIALLRTDCQDKEGNIALKKHFFYSFSFSTLFVYLVWFEFFSFEIRLKNVMIGYTLSFIFDIFPTFGLKIVFALFREIKHYIVYP